MDIEKTSRGDSRTPGCDCSSCVHLGHAQPRRVGDCDACNAGGDTTVIQEFSGHFPITFDVCAKCALDPAEALAAIAERAASIQADADRCWRNHAE